MCVFVQNSDYKEQANRGFRQGPILGSQNFAFYMNYLNTVIAYATCHKLANICCMLTVM